MSELVVKAGKKEDFKGSMSEMDKARREYEEEYKLADLLDEEVVFTGASLSKMIEPKDKDGKPFAYLELYDDDDQTVVKIGLNFPFLTETPQGRRGYGKFYPLVSAVTGLDDEVIQVNYEALRKAVSEIKSITITAVEEEGDDFEYISYEIVKLES